VYKQDAIFRDLSYLWAAIVDSAIVMLFYIQCWILPGQQPMNIEYKSYQDFDSM
jgi:hypothetical protein